MKNFISTIENFLLKKINVDRYLPIQLDITNSCNLRCVHCYHPHHKNEGAISFDDWKNILLQYKSLIRKMKYRPSVVLCGGEPFVNPKLNQLLEFIVSILPESSISILTNGTLITDAKANELKKYKNLRFQVSLDGPDPERHNLIRGQGNFQKALTGIQILKSHGFEVNVLSVLTAKTSLWMEDFFQLAARENFNSINFIRFIPEGYGRTLLNNSEDQPLSAEELKMAYEKLIKLMIKYQVKSKTQMPLMELVIPGLGRSGRFWESIVVDYQGYIIASSRSQLRLGHAITEGLEKIFTTNEIYSALRSAKVEGCGTCSLYDVCGGDRNAAHAASGNFLGKDPGCWKNNSQQKFLEKRAL